MTDTTTLAGSRSPTNVLAATVYNPFAGATDDHPLGFPVGTPVAPQNIDAASPHTVFPADASDGTVAHVIGLASSPGVVGSRGNVQSQGVLTLSPDEWDQVTGDVGGLVHGAPYYLSDGGVDGHLTRTPPVDIEHFVVRVGIGLSPTDMLILVCCPVLNQPQNG